MAFAAQLEPVTAWRRPDILISSLFVNLLGLALPLSMLQVYDRIIPNASYSTFTIMLVGLAVVIALEAAFKVLRSHILSAFGARYEHANHTAAFNRLINADISEFDKNSPGTYADQIQGIQNIREFYSGQAATLAIDIPFIFLFLGLLWYIAGILVLVPLLLLGTLLAIVYVLNQELAYALKQRSETDRRRYNFLVETLQGVHTVKSLAMERLMLRRYERLQEKSAKGVVDLTVIQATSTGLASTFSQLSMVLYVSCGSYFVINQSLTLGGLAAGTMLTGRVLQPFMRGLTLWTRYQSVLIAQERLDTVFELPAENPEGRTKIEQIKGDIRLSNLTFAFPNSEQPVFEGLDLDIKAGSMVGLTGPNGSGLSTILDLINGTLTPSEGDVKIDGRPLKELDLISYRNHVGFMPENGQLFNGTLLENLTMFQEGEARKRAVDVLRLVGLEEFVLSLPKGLETPLGGSVISNLPLGILQRLTIARTLVNDPKIILFDNAHSGLDVQADERLRDVFQQIRSDKTIILATYRPSFLRMCDHVYEIRARKLVDWEPPSYGSAPPTQISASGSGGKAS